MKILFVEDDSRVTDAVQEICNLQGIECEVSNDGRTGLEKALDNKYDVILLDIMLPELSGLEILHNLRGIGNRTPIIMVSAKGTDEDIAKSKDLGADDHLIKPFSLKELFAKIRALSKRTETDKLPDMVYLEEVVYDSNKKILHYGNNVSKLTKKESLIFEVFLREPDKILTKEVICDSVWGHSHGVSISNVDVYIYNLRKKLEGTNLKIDNIRGVGFVLRRV